MYNLCENCSKKSVNVENNILELINNRYLCVNWQPKLTQLLATQVRLTVIFELNFI